MVNERFYDVLDELSMHEKGKTPLHPILALKDEGMFKNENVMRDKIYEKLKENDSEIKIIEKYLKEIKCHHDILNSAFIRSFL